MGKRQPEIYSNISFDKYISQISQEFPELDITYYQSNSEGDIIDQLQQAEHSFEGIILNAGAYSHSSIAIADAIKLINATRFLLSSIARTDQGSRILTRSQKEKERYNRNALFLFTFFLTLTLINSCSFSFRASN